MSTPQHDHPLSRRDLPILARLSAAGFSRPDTGGPKELLNPYRPDYFYALHSIMLDRPYAGQKTHDVLCVLDWLKAQGREEIHLVAKGWGALTANG